MRTKQAYMNATINKHFKGFSHISPETWIYLKFKKVNLHMIKKCIANTCKQQRFTANTVHLLQKLAESHIKSGTN